MLTGAGRLPHAAIIHVAGIDLLWRASERSICDSVRNAIAVASAHDLKRVALPVIGAGSGGFNEARALELIVRTLRDVQSSGHATVVRYQKPA